jgi:putative two-component system response regulator
LGKISISDEILNKPGKLTPEEFAIMKTHVEKGVEAIEKMERYGHFADFLKLAKEFAATHHEKWDGSGYPRGLKGQDIPLEGRIMAIVDVYDALISARPYKKAFSAEESARIIIEGSGIHFDPMLVNVFKKITDKFAAIAKDYNDDCPISKSA